MGNTYVRKLVENTISDSVSDILYYDRKEDFDLPRGEIERLIEIGELTIDEMVEWFRDSLERGIS